VKAHGDCSICKVRIELAGDAGDVRRLNEHAAHCRGDVHVTPSAPAFGVAERRWLVSVLLLERASRWRVERL